MTDDIRQQLEQAWPGMWPTGAESHWGDGTYTRLEHDYAAVFWRSGPGAWCGELRIRSHHADVTIEQSKVECETPTHAARALRARAEILVDALERMDDETHDFNPDYAAHPREHLQEWIDAHGGYHEAVPPDGDAVVRWVLSGEDVDEPTAHALQSATGIDASFWLNLQRKYDEVHNG